MDEVLEQLLADLGAIVEQMCAQQRRDEEWPALVRELREGHPYDPRANRAGS